MIKELFVMTQEKIDRINELARKSRTPEGLTPAEKEEQTALRNEYRAGFVRNLKAQLDNIEVVDAPKLAEGDDRKIDVVEEDQ